MNKTKISWTDQTANPIRARNRQTGKRGWHCVKVSPGCAHCYSERMNLGPYGNGLRFLESERANVELYLEEKVLEDLERQRKSNKCFIVDMSDLFQRHVKLSWIVRIWATMAITEHITYQVLTKRADRMHRILNSQRFQDALESCRNVQVKKHGWMRPKMPYPLPNVWLGVSAENQHFYNERVPLLLDTPAAKRFVSIEPMLGPVKMQLMPDGENCLACGDNDHQLFECHHVKAPRVDQVICGGESGPDFRLMNLNHARSLRDQCNTAKANGHNVAFFFKQSSGLKSETGTTLDGVTWHEFPTVEGEGTRSAGERIQSN